MIIAIVVAAGKGTRMKGTVRKQYLALAGKPILNHTLTAIASCGKIDTIFLVIPGDDFTYCRQKILSGNNFSSKVKLVRGGKERQESVYNGLVSIRDKNGIIVIHDGVRPFIQTEEIEECIRGAENYGACILGVPAYETLKRVDKNGNVLKTLNRGNLRFAQTPQAFKYSVIMEAFEKAKTDCYTGTDDAALVERTGKHVKIIDGSRFNIKITTQEDLVFADALMKIRSDSKQNRFLPK